MSAPVRILCVDDNPHFLDVMCEYIQLQEEFEVAGTATDGKEALEQAMKLQPDVILLDLNLGEESALHLIPHIKKQVPVAKIVIVTIADGGSYQDVALKAGADAFVHKSYLTKLLVPNIYRLMKITLKPLSSTSKNEYLPFSRLIENSKDLIYRYEVEPKRGFTYVNPAAPALTGYTPDEHYADPDLGFKLVHPDDRVLLESATQGGVSESQPITLRWIRKDGAIIWTEQYNVPIYDESGRLIAIEGTARDVTERKQTEDNLLETENKFKYVFDNSIVGKSITLPSGEITVNKAFCEMLGYSQGELQKKNWREISHPEDVTLSQEVIASILSGERDSARFTKRYIRKDGVVVWAEVNTALRRDQAGNPLYFMTMANDITGRIQNEDKLRESERFVRSILDAIPSHISVLDENGTIIAVNHPWLEFTIANDGDPKKTGLGMNYLDICDRATPKDKYAVEIAEGIRAVMRGENDAFSLEYPCHSPFEERWFVAHASRMEESGPLCIVVKHENITERKQSEQALLDQKDLLNKSQEIAQVGSWEYDPNKNRLIWSDEAYRIFGVHPQEFTPTYEEFLAIVHPDDREAVNSAYTKSLIEGENGYTIEHRIVKRDTGETHIVLEKCEHTRDAGGNIIRSIGMVQDITRQKKLEHDIQERMKELQCLYRVQRDMQEDFPLDVLCERMMTEIAQAMQFPEATAVKIELNGNQYTSPLYIPGLDQCLRAEIKPNGQLAGNLSVYSIIKEKDFIIPEEADMVETIANAIGKWLAQKQAEEKIQKQIHRLHILRKIDQGIAGSLHLHSLLETILEQTMTELGVDAGIFLLYDPDKHILKYEHGIGMNTNALRHTKLKLGEGYAGKAAQSGETVYIPNLQKRTTDFLRSPSFSLEGFCSYFGVPLIIKGKIKGVLELFHRAPLTPDQEWLDFMETLAGQAAIAIDNATLFKDLEQTNTELVTAYDATIAGWSRAMDLRDKETEGHTQRVTELTVILAELMGISQHELVQIKRGALLHDIGKLGVPDHILLKPDKLTDEEWNMMRQHPSFAYKMLLPIPYLRPALDIPYCHHEKWDGTGYPRGLKGDQIPFAARIFAITDVWDALTSARHYRAAWTKERTLEYIREQAGKHFDPQVVKVFLELVQ